MKRLAGLAFLTAVLVSLCGCSLGNPNLAEPTDTSENQATASIPAPTSTDEPESGLAGPLTLRIWVPPGFSPDPNSEAGVLLKARLDEFVLLHPGVRITVRIKAETGAGGMIRSLESMSAAVPAALPDLILASRPELERAAADGLLDIYSSLDDGWYGFAGGLSEFEGQVIGLPFAADALLLLYRTGAAGQPAVDWERTLGLENTLLFAAGDPSGLLTLAYYLSAGGTLRGEDGSPSIDPSAMAEVFQYYLQGQDAGIFHSWMSGLESQEDVYASLQTGSAPAGIVWASDMLADLDPDFRATNIPAQEGEALTLATGWLWALSNPDSPHRELSEELARSLTDAVFMGEWTRAAGYLPTRPDGLAVWPIRIETAFASRVLMAALPIPPLAILETSGPRIREALIELWDGNLTPMEAAETVFP